MSALSHIPSAAESGASITQRSLAPSAPALSIANTSAPCRSERTCRRVPADTASASTSTAASGRIGGSEELLLLLLLLLLSPPPPSACSLFERTKPRPRLPPISSCAAPRRLRRGARARRATCATEKRALFFGDRQRSVLPSSSAQKERTTTTGPRCKKRSCPSHFIVPAVLCAFTQLPSRRAWD